VGVTPDNPAPIRLLLWLASADVNTDTSDGVNDAKRLGSQRRFEMPPLREVSALVSSGREEGSARAH
jgi:hypothetical protein